MSINEKFKENTDPVKDLRIGMEAIIKKWILENTEYKYDEGDRLWICAQEKQYKFVEYLLDLTGTQWGLNYALYLACENGDTKLLKLLLDKGRPDKDQANEWNELLDDEVNKVEKPEMIEMINKYIKRKKKSSIKESFTEQSDPIKDMNIGMTPQDIAKRFLKESQGSMEWISETYFGNRSKYQGYAYVLYSFFKKLDSGVKNPKVAFFRACEDENYYGTRADIVEDRTKIATVIKDRFNIEVDPIHVFESFSNESDPIKDMSIGATPYQISKEFFKNDKHFYEKDINKLYFPEEFYTSKATIVYWFFRNLFADYDIDRSFWDACDRVGYNISDDIKFDKEHRKYREQIADVIYKNWGIKVNTELKLDKSMKIVRESIGTGAGYSMSSFAGSRGGIGGAGNLGKSNTMYTYEIKPLTHTLEQKPTASMEQNPTATDNNQMQTIQLGSKITGNLVRSNVTFDANRKVTGIVRDIVKSDMEAIEYYLVFDEESKKLVMVDPLGVHLDIPEPVRFYPTDTINSIPSKRKEMLKRAQKDKSKKSVFTSYNSWSKHKQR